MGSRSKHMQSLRAYAAMKFVPMHGCPSNYQGTHGWPVLARYPVTYEAASMRRKAWTMQLLWLCIALLNYTASAQLFSSKPKHNKEGERWLGNGAFLEDMLTLRRQFGGMGDDILSSFFSSARKSPRLGQSGGSTSNMDAAAVLGDCGSMKDMVFAQIQLALQMSMSNSIQDGELDFGFLGAANETEACAGQTCAYTNPSSPYGLTVLPLSINETATRKMQQNIPDFLRKDMQQRNDLPKTSTTLRQRLEGRQQDSTQSSSTPLTAAQDRGASAIWQLEPEEVVLVAGCLPPRNTSRYFAWTPYLHSLKDDKVGKWVTVFASLGDSIGMYTRPDGKGNITSHGTRNRMNSSLPHTTTSAATSANMQQSAESFGATSLGPESIGATSLGRLGGNGLGVWLHDMLSNHTADNSSSSIRQSTAHHTTEQDGNSQGSATTGTGKTMWAGLFEPQVKAANGPPADPPTLYHDVTESHKDPCGQFTVVMMAASTDSARKIRATLDPLLARLGLQGALNVLPIGQPFASNLGLQEQKAYFMLLARNILGAGQMPQFKQYLQAQPWKVWRITPRTNLLGFGLLPLLSSPSFNPTKSGYPAPHVVPRASPQRQQSEAWLQPAMQWLLKQVDRKLAGEGKARSWSLGADSGLGAAGIDWGIDCYQKRIDYCNGDNRDAQYITSMPMVSLDRASKVLYIVGVNHVATGLASFVNIATSDPIQRLGLNSWDDQEMRGSADAYMQGGPYQGLSSLFYVIAYARDCKGVPFCKVIPITGARSLPLSRGMLVILRAYVNPLTGVGPDAADMVNFRTVVATPRSQAMPRDTHALVANNEAITKSPCKVALVTTAVACSQTLSATAWPGNNTTIRVLPTLARVGNSLEGSLCCKATADWGTDQCWCSSAGQHYLDMMSPLPTRAMIAGVARVCGHPVRQQLLECR